MTVCVGWLNQNNAFIVTDSAATVTNSSNQPEATSVGEYHNSTEYQLEETAAKFAKLSDFAVGAVVGDAGTGLSALNTVRSRMAKFSTLEEWLSPFLQSPPPNTPEFQLLLAIQVNSRSTLWRVDPFDSCPLKEIYEDAEPIVLGSLPEQQKQMIKVVVKGLCNEKPLQLDPDHSLSSIITILQAMGQRSKFAINNVGGLFFGTRVGLDGVCYQKDIVHIIYERSPSDTPTPFHGTPLFALSCIRSGLMIASSTFLGTKVKVFTNDVIQLTRDEETSILDSFIKTEDGETLYSNGNFYSFMDKVTGAIVLVDCRPGAPQYFKVKGDQLTIESALLTSLKSLPRLEANGAAPIEVPIILLGDKPKGHE